MPRLWGCGFLCFSILFGQARAAVLDIQDNSPALVYSGQWFADASPNAHGKHETWTNARGASVYYDFQGSKVEVFATQRPTGTYLTNVSFQIDGNAPDFWVTNENVTQETFNKLVYTSPGTLGLSTDGLHRVTITNYGFVFWLVYLEIMTPDVSGTGRTNTASTSTPTGTGTQTSSAGTSGSNDSSKSASRTPVIVGAVVGSVGGVALLLAALWVWCVYTRSRRRKLDAMAARPFAGEANPSANVTKDRPPPNPPSRFQRWIVGSQATASEPGYGYPSTGETPNAPQALERAQSEPEPADAEALKQLAVFRSTVGARAGAGATPEREPLRVRGTRPPPAASIPTTVTLETPYPSTTQSVSPRSAAAAAPVSRSGALARVFSFTFSSRLSRNPARARAPPTDSDATMSSVLASSGVLPPPSPYTPPDRSRAGAVFFRVLRRSQDGGVRLAGGAPEEMVQDADMVVPEEYDRQQQVLEAMSEGSTLPPEYQQYPTTRGEGERGGAGR